MIAVRDALEERAAAGELVLLLNTADDPVVEQQRFHLIEHGVQERWERAAAQARRWLERAAVLGGERELRFATSGEAASLELTWAGVMGVRYPAAVECSLPKPEPGACGPSSAAMDQAIVAHRVALQAAAAHAITVEACRLIDAEVVKVRRRLTAISERWLPRLDQALRDFERDLEESERSENARLRRLIRPFGQRGWQS